MTPPDYVKQNARALQVFRSVVKYIKANGGPEKVYVEGLAIYANAVSEYEYFTERLAKNGYLIQDDKGNWRRNPEEIIRNAAFQQISALSKKLGIDRDFHVKGREKALSLGKPQTKTSRLRKLASKAS